MKLKILAFGAHPDDVELSCSGTLLSHIAEGDKVGIVDLTRGELGTRGTAEIRDQEAAAAARIMGVSVRENLEFADGFFVNDKKHQLAIVKMLRKYQPEIVLANAIEDRHPDHGKGAAVVRDACFLAGLSRIETEIDGVAQERWRPRLLLHYIQDRWLQPDIVVDISDFVDLKMQAIQAYSSQFFNPDSKEPTTYIATEAFLQNIYSRAAEHGRPVGFAYGEGFTANKLLGTKSLNEIY